MIFLENKEEKNGNDKNNKKGGDRAETIMHTSELMDKVPREQPNQLQVLFGHSPLPPFMPNVPYHQDHLGQQHNPYSPCQLSIPLLNHCIRDGSWHRIHQVRCLLSEGAMQGVKMFLVIFAM